MIAIKLYSYPRVAPSTPLSVADAAAELVPKACRKANRNGAVARPPFWIAVVAPNALPVLALPTTSGIHGHNTHPKRDKARPIPT